MLGHGSFHATCHVIYHVMSYTMSHVMCQDMSFAMPFVMNHVIICHLMSYHVEPQIISFAYGILHMEFCTWNVTRGISHMEFCTSSFTGGSSHVEVLHVAVFHVEHVNFYMENATCNMSNFERQCVVSMLRNVPRMAYTLLWECMFFLSLLKTSNGDLGGHQTLR